MNSKLILVEGLPGFGKTTTANLIHEILSEQKVNAELFLEGNLDHPADYDGVAYFNQSDFESLLENSGNFKETINDRIMKKENQYLLPYAKIKHEYGPDFPDHLLSTIFKHDIYELPFDKNFELITNRWREFAEQASKENKTYIFECCFIQNPITIGLVKYGEPKEKIVNYVRELANIIEKLNPILFYIEQEDLEFSFRKAVKDRPTEWSIGFIEYYTNQGFGKMNGYKGLDGTIKVLEARKSMEEEIFNNLYMKKVKINNSKYEASKYKSTIIEKLNLF